MHSPMQSKLIFKPSAESEQQTEIENMKTTFALFSNPVISWFY